MAAKKTNHGNFSEPSELPFRTRLEENAQCSSWYDSSLLTSNPVSYFDQASKARKNLSCTQGRGPVYPCEISGINVIIRHYFRGGLVARWLNDRYLGWHLAHTRAWREWQVLAQLYAKGLPVPRPIAARVCWSKPYYRCDLMMQKITDASSLIELARKRGNWGSETSWHSVGRMLALFAQNSLCHTDVNLGNILKDQKGKLYLIDFDRACFRGHPMRLKNRMFKRLCASMRKLWFDQQAISLSQAQACLKEGLWQQNRSKKDQARDQND